MLLNILTADANKGKFEEGMSLEGWTFKNSQYATTKVEYKKPFGTSPTPTRTGYGFAGWWTQKDGGIELKSSDIISDFDTTTIYAHWDKQSYTVTADANGGTIKNANGWTLNENNTQQVTKQLAYESEYGTLPEVERDGYIFEGWYTEKTGGSRITNSTQVSQDSNHTIYARWGCIGLNPGIYTSGTTIQYAGLDWTVIANNSTNVSLALNDVKGSGTYNNAANYLENNFINTNNTLRGSKELGCLVNQGTSSAPAYVTSNSGSSAANKPGYEHWISSGSVYLPNQINRYTTSNGVYVKGYRVSCEFLVRTAYATSISSSVLYSAGSTYSASNSNSSITFASASYTTSKTGMVADVISTFYLDKDECKSPNSKKLAISRDVESNLTISGGGTVGDTNKYCGTKVVKAIVCGGSYDGNTASFTARDSNTYSHVNASGASDSRTYYSSYLWWEYAGTAHSTTTGTAGSNLVRTFNFRTDSHCSDRNKYTVQNLTKDIYYRPFIKVYKK